MGRMHPYLREQFRLIKPKIGRLPGAYRRAAHHPSGLQRHERARPVGGKERRLLHRHTPSRRAAPKPGNKPLSFADYVAIREKIEAVCTHTYD